MTDLKANEKRARVRQSDSVAQRQMGGDTTTHLIS